MMLSDATVRELESRLSGQLLTPADEGYDAARSVFNAMMDPIGGPHSSPAVRTRRMSCAP